MLLLLLAVLEATLIVSSGSGEGQQNNTFFTWQRQFSLHLKEEQLEQLKLWHMAYTQCYDKLEIILIDIL